MPEHDTERNVALVQAFWDTVWNQGELERIPGFMVEQFVLHSAGAAIGPRSEFSTWVNNFRSAVNELRFIIQDLFGSADKVVTRWEIRGGHNGVLGLPATGEPIAFTGITIFRVTDGKIQEGWVERSAYELHQRLTKNL